MHDIVSFAEPDARAIDMTLESANDEDHMDPEVTQPESQPDAFPRHELFQLLKRLPQYGRLAWAIGRDPSLSASRRGAVMAAAAYLISPIDLVPGIIPVVGQMDDLVVLLIGLRFALAGLSPERRRRHLADARLSESAMTEDIEALQAMGRWALYRGADITMMGLQRAISIGRRSTSVGRRIVGRTSGTVAAVAEHAPRRNRPSGDGA